MQAEYATADALVEERLGRFELEAEPERPLHAASMITVIAAAKDARVVLMAEEVPRNR
jgi:hypothetical protein